MFYIFVKENGKWYNTGHYRFFPYGKQPAATADTKYVYYLEC